MTTMTPDEFQDLRQQLGWSVSQAGPFLGVNRRAIQRWENGQARIPHAVALWLRYATQNHDACVFLSIHKVKRGLDANEMELEERKLGMRRGDIRARQAWYAEGDVTREQLIEIYKLADGRCVYCGGPVHPRFTPSNPGGFDHVVPFSKNGKHTAGNLVVCCRRCNLRKGAKLKS